MGRNSHGMSDKTFDIINNFLVFIITLIVVYPFIFVISASISDPMAVSTGKMWLWPVDITFSGYQKVFANENIWIGYRNTIFYTLLGTAMHLAVLLPMSYALSRRGVMGKKFIQWFVLFTMMFSGGLIPTYLVVKKLGMLNTVWSVTIPGLVGAWSILVTRSFFEANVPEELVEVAKIDGASDFLIFRKIALPLSKPIIAVMALFHGVSLWNQYFKAMIYLSDRKMYPLQLFLREILVINQVSDEAGGVIESLMEQVKTAAQIKYGVIIVSSLPLLLIYPFIQKYFVQGTLIGSIKE